MRSPPKRICFDCAGRLLLLAMIGASAPDAAAAPATRPSSAPAYSPGVRAIMRARIRALDNRYPVNREMMAEVLGRDGPASDEVRAALEESMTDGDRFVRIAAARAVHTLWPDSNDEVLPVLSEGVRFGTIAAQIKAIEALQEHHDETSSLIVNYTRDKMNPTVHELVERALTEIAAARRDRETARHDADVVVSVTRAALRDPDLAARLAAVSELASATTLSDEDEADLKVGLVDADAGVRSAAALALLNHRMAPDPEMIVALRELLRNGNHPVAIHAVGMLADEGATPQLVALLDNPNPDVQNAAAYALAHIGAPARPALIKLAEIYEHRTPWSGTYPIAFALSTLPDGQALLVRRAAAALSSPDSWIRSEAIDHLSLVPPAALKPAAPNLIALLSDSDQAIRLNALILLGTMGPDAASAAPNITRLADNARPEMRHVAAQTLLQIDRGGDQLAAVLVTAVLHDDRAMCDELLAAIPADRSKPISDTLGEMSRSDLNARVRKLAGDLSQTMAARGAAK